MHTPWRFESVPTVASTNTDLLDRWHQHALVEPVSLLAYEQTAGRGRRGKSWLSATQQSLTFSLAFAFPPKLSMMHLQGLSLVCGLSVLQSLMAFLQLSNTFAKERGLGLKWPNDILLQNQKLGGILVEGGQKSPDLPIWMIIGVGLNLSPHSNNPERSDIAYLEDINPLHISLEREPLWRLLTLNLGHTLEVFTEKSFATFQQEWNHWDCWSSHMLSLRQDAQTLLSGKNLGVNASGYLLMETPMGVREIASGDVSLRKLFDER